MIAEPNMIDAELINSFRRDGFVVVPQLISRQEAVSIREIFMKQNENGPVPGLSEMKHGNQDAYDKGDPLRFYPRMMLPHTHPELPVGSVAMQYMIDRRIGAVLTELMGSTPYAVQTMFYFKPPGARGQDFHQDNFYLRVKPGTCMAAWIALDDCDEANGGMMCVPDTQDYAIQCPEKANSELYFTTEHVAVPEGKSAVLPKMRPGDVLFFNGSTVHGSGPNTSTDRFRRSLICHYVPADTAQISHWYEKAIDFSGNSAFHIQSNPDGGPCGTLQATGLRH